MIKILQELRNENVGKVLENEPLSQHTTIKIGGPCDIYIEPNNSEGLKKALAITKEYGLKWRAIGRGSNLLVSDKGIEGVVIKLGDGMDDLTIDGTTVTVGGGFSLVRLTTILSKKGLAGLQFAGGIPGSVGGAVYMNAGAHGSDISKVLTKALILFEDGNLEWLTNNQLQFSYRTSILQEKRKGICVEAVFQLEKGNKEEIISELQKNKDYRKDTQPFTLPCAGSVFRNPLPNFAGQLIEQAGLKGYSIGGAKISELHANFIVNTGGAKASDVLSLIKFAKDKIFAQFQIKLETEIEIIGRE